MPCCLLLDRVLRLHIQFVCHLIAIIGKKIIVEWFLITSYRAANTSSMRREYRTNLWQLIVDIQSAKSTHPLVGMINHLGIVVEGLAFNTILIKAFNNQRCGIREHRGLVIVTVGMERINTVVLPQPAIDFILLFKIRLEIHQDSNRLTWDCPTSYSYRQSLFLSLPLPLGKERLILFKIRTFHNRRVGIVIIFLPEVRTNKNNPILHLIL